MVSETMVLKGNTGSSSLILTSGALLSLRFLRTLIIMLLNAAVLLLLLPFRRERRRVAVVAAAVEKSGKDEKQPQAVVRFSAAAKAAVAARRELAVKRVMEDRDPNTVREYSLMGTKRDDTIFTQSWTPVSGKIR